MEYTVYTVDQNLNIRSPSSLYVYQCLVLHKPEPRRGNQPSPADYRAQELATSPAHQIFVVSDTVRGDRR